MSFSEQVRDEWEEIVEAYDDPAAAIGRWCLRTEELGWEEVSVNPPLSTVAVWLQERREMAPSPWAADGDGVCFVLSPPRPSEQ